MKSVIRIVRFFLSATLIAISLYILFDDVSYLFIDDVRHVVIDGFVSTWAMFGLFFLGCSALAMSIASNGSWRTSKFNRLYVASVLINAVVISPMLSSVVWYQLHEKSKGFVECEDLRRSSRRHSSKTYAITPQECQLLVSDRQAREL